MKSLQNDWSDLTKIEQGILEQVDGIATLGEVSDEFRRVEILVQLSCRDSTTEIQKTLIAVGDNGSREALRWRKKPVVEGKKLRINAPPHIWF